MWSYLKGLGIRQQEGGKEGWRGRKGREEGEGVNGRRGKEGEKGERGIGKNQRGRVNGIN